MRKKIEAILKQDPPKNVAQLQSYLGMVNYYAKFIPNLATELNPLYSLLKKNAHFEWTQKHNEAFERCKKLLVSNNVLALYDPTKEIIISCDASPYGVGCVLSQIFNGVEKPVLFASSSLSAAEKNYSQVHREALALVFSVKKFHKYIYGKKFTIRTDCQALREIFGDKNIPAVAAARLQRWSIFLSMYQYTIEYKSAFGMRNADGLSRLPLQGDTDVDGGCINSLRLNTGVYLPISMKTVQEATAKDETLQLITKYVLFGWPSKVDKRINHYFLKRKSLASEDSCLFYGERILIPFCLRRKVLELLHDTHIGMVRMKALARTYVWWPGIDLDIENWCKCCRSCQSLSYKKNESELSNWPATHKPFERVHIDFFNFQGNEFLILVDSYTKWLEVFLMRKTDAKSTIEKLRSVFTIFGLPNQIVSDNGPPFQSIEFEQFCESNGIILTHSPPLHPQSNGEAEVSVRIVKQSLKKLVIDEKTKNIPISMNVSNFLLKYRITPTTATGKSPASLILGYSPKTLFDVINRKSFESKTDITNGKADQHTDNNSSKLVNSRKQNNDNRKNNFNNDKIVKYEINEIVSYQNVYDKTVKWIPAKIKNIVSKSVYEIQLSNGSCKTAHLRQLRKTKARNLVEWPGYFVNERDESNPVEIIESNLAEDDSVQNSVQRNRKRKRKPRPSANLDLRRSERLAKVAKPNYRM